MSPHLLATQADLLATRAELSADLAALETRLIRRLRGGTAFLLAIAVAFLKLA